MPLRVGIVGLEPGTHFSAYLAAARESPEVELVAVSLRPDLVASVAALLEPFAVPIYHDPIELLDAERPDVLALGAVPSEQAPLLLEGLSHLQHVLTAALNVRRLGAWWDGRPFAPTRCAAFLALAPAG